MLLEREGQDTLANQRLLFLTSVAAADLALLGAAATLHQRWIAQLTIIGALLLGKKVLDARDQVGARVVLYAALQGVGLLWWDWLHIRKLGTLAYPSSGPFIGLSPFYMPFAWTVTLTPIFGLAVSLNSRLSAARSAVIAGLTGSAF